MTTDTTPAPAAQPPPAPTPAVAPPVPAAPPHARRNIRWAVWCAAAAVVIVVGYFAFHWWTYRASHSITDDAFVEAHIVNVAPEMVSGRIVRFLVEENDQVEEGQVLAVIEPVHYADQVEQARGKLELAEAELKRQQAGLDKLKKEVPLQIAIAAQTLAGAQTEVSRAKDALKLTTEEVNKTVNVARTGREQIREVEFMAGVKEEMVKDARIGLDSAKHQFQFTQVRAPFPGVVVKRYRSLGDFVSAGVPILSMYNPDLLYVTANLEETRLRGVAPGNPVELHLDAFDRPFQGRVVWINKSTGAQFALMPRNVVAGEFTKVVQRVPVRIWIEKDDRWPLLRAGLSAQVVIAHGAGDAAWAEQAARDMAQLERRYNQQKK